MSLEKIVVVDRIEVVENGSVQVRTCTRIVEDGNQISQTFHRTSLTPGQDLTDQPANVVIRNKRGRKRKVEFDPRQYDSEYITLWEDIVDGQGFTIEQVEEVK